MTRLTAYSCTGGTSPSIWASGPRQGQPQASSKPINSQPPSQCKTAMLLTWITVANQLQPHRKKERPGNENQIPAEAEKTAKLLQETQALTGVKGTNL